MASRRIYHIGTISPVDLLPRHILRGYRQSFVMRPSAIVRSGMPTGPKYMGWWGDMGGPAQRGVYEYTLSPRQQNAMNGALRAYLFHGYKRTISQVPYFAIPFGLCYAIYAWGKSRYEYLESKEGHRLHGGGGEE